ncbi:hypothetical protein L9F63_021482, partial [Diploptera punctata]
ESIIERIEEKELKCLWRTVSTTYTYRMFHISTIISLCCSLLIHNPEVCYRYIHYPNALPNIKVNTSSTTTSSSSDGGVQKDEGENKKLKLRFDVSQYQPEEIVVKTVDNKLLVHAKHEEKSESKSVYREYNREFMLPKGTNPESIKSSLSKDGVLTVEAPLPAIEGEKLIPIAQQ